MDFFNDNVKKYSKWIIAICAACIIIFLALQNIGQVALFIKGVFSTVKPLILGLAIALIINVPMKFFEKHIFKSSEKKFIKRIKSPVCFIISILLIIPSNKVFILLFSSLTLTLIIESSFANSTYSSSKLSSIIPLIIIFVCVFISLIKLKSNILIKL